MPEPQRLVAAFAAPLLLRAGIVAAAIVAHGGCAAAPPAHSEKGVSRAEASFLAARDLADALDVLEARELAVDDDGRPVEDLEDDYGAAHAATTAALAAATPKSDADRAALARMREALASEMRSTSGSEAAKSDDAPPCDDPARLAATPGGSDGLSAALYACYGARAMRIEVDGETVDRLTVFARLAREPDPEARRRLFLSFSPLWRTVDGDPGRGAHPYRELVRRSAAEWRAKGSPVDRQLRALGLDPAVFERDLEKILATWRESFGGEEIEPWDLHWTIGGAARELAAAVPRDRLEEIGRRYYADLGADLSGLSVRYDLEPRDGKTPVAFCTFGRRGRSLGGDWLPTIPWVFATYRTGGFDNLGELLHESGHAVHLAAIRTRPAFLDWPDLDAFTEGLADFWALEAYEPEWQRRYLGASVPLADALRSKYGSIVMDVAWALFEIRMHRSPERAPNDVWSELLESSFGVRPHPEISWWALRGQLISSPGYMSNYAIGAVLVADLRAEARRRMGPFHEPDASRYPRIAESFYRSGREVPSRRLIEAYLGRAPSSAALLADLARGAGG